MALAAPDIVQWASPSRALSKRESSDFFDAPLQRLTLFSFVTRDMKVAPHRGPLSLKTVFSGGERYRIGRRDIVLRPGQVLLVNAEERYASAIESETESLSLFIPGSDATAALCDAFNGHGLVEEAPPRPAGFAQTPFTGSSQLTAALASVRTRLRRGEPGVRMANALQRLLVDAFAGNLALAPPEALRNVRAPTRDEIVSRVGRARAFIVERVGQDCALTKMASIACMSPYHFVRRFGELYGETPAAFARRLRLTAARIAIANGADKLGAARCAGYASLDAFTRALRHAGFE